MTSFSAFISYRHVEPDLGFAAYLQRWLEQYRVPAGPPVVPDVLRPESRRFRPVFRDTSEMSACADLPAAIERALAESEWLVVVCTPATRGAEWIEREVAHFVSVRGADRVLTVLLDGSPSTSFPRALTKEPRAANAESRRRWRSAALEVAAGMLGWGIDEIVQRDRAARRRRSAVRAVLAVLLLTAITIGAIELSGREELDQVAAGLILRRAQQELQAPGFDHELPENLPRLQRWLADTETLLARRSEFEAMLASIEPGEAGGAGERAADPSSAAMRRDELTRLLASLDELEAERQVVERRAFWVSRIAGASIGHPGAACSWDEVRAELANDPGLYRSKIEFTDDDVIGLVPMGRNRRTGLFEFYHMRSAWYGSGSPADLRVPALGADGAMKPRSETGIVFVLVPGHTWSDGRQRVPIAPFFLARHELTRGQWLRLGGDDVFWHIAESMKHDGGVVSDALPAEQMTWHAAVELLARHGLCLPTALQWWFAAGAGRRTGWWHGDDVVGLASHANLRDLGTKGIFEEPGEPEPFRDGFVRLAPVGSLAGNPFGFHDVHGNVSEWCRDQATSARPRPGDGLRTRRPGDPDNGVVVLGGGYKSPAREARLNFGGPLPPGNGYPTVGLRAARTLTGRPVSAR